MSDIRIMVRGIYDLQKLRIQIGNRIVANYRSRLGLQPSDKESTDADAEKVLKQLRTEYRTMMEGITSGRMTSRKFKGNEVISSYTEMSLLEQYVGMEERERIQFKMLEDVVATYPIWAQYLSDVKGIGPAITAILISEIDISKATYPSSLWKYAGLDVAQDGRGRGRYADHLVDVEYKARDGDQKTRKSITFNPFLKAKLLGVAAASLIKQKGEFADVYYGYKNRIEQMPTHQTVYTVTGPDKQEVTLSNVTLPDNPKKTYADQWGCSSREVRVFQSGKSPRHRHYMAVRYMIKIFLQKLYNEWRTIEGLPVAPTYAEAKLGLKHGEAEGKQEAMEAMQ
jgi:hypothetical protein